MFDSTGMLTAAGDDTYNRALANLPTWWKSPHTGEVFGTRPPPKPGQVEDPSSLPVTLGPEHPMIVEQVYSATWRIHYEPVMLKRRMGKLTIIEEHDPRHSGAPHFLAVVRNESDKAAAGISIMPPTGTLVS